MPARQALRGRHSGIPRNGKFLHGAGVRKNCYQGLQFRRNEGRIRIGFGGVEDMELEGKKNKNGFCVLVADDEPKLLELLSSTLKRDGFTVIQAANGQDALRAARSYKGAIDLLVTDVEMPSLDGFDLQERLRMERPQIKLLVISGALDENITGVDFPILKKPFAPSEFSAKVREVLAQ
jgi:CheY-like chemotaxis protein